VLCFALSALTLLAGCQEEHPACKQIKVSFEVLVWLSVWSKLQIACMCSMPSQNPPSSLASFKSRLVLPFWYWLTQVVPEKRPLNGYAVVSFSSDAAAAEHNYAGTDDKLAEPSYNRDDASTREVVEMSKLPDAQQPCDDEIPAIERADWPAPPHPAAAYPELCMCDLV